MVHIASVTKEEAKAFGILAKKDLSEHPLQGTILEAKRNKEMVNEIDLDLFRGGTPFLLFENSQPVSLHITRMSSRKRKDAWGRYCNFYLAYTLPSHRYKGYASALCTFVQDQLQAEGYDRMKSLIGSWGGFRLHLSLGHTLWGLAPNGCIVVDFPLRKGIFPSSTPRLIRSYGLSEEWSVDSLITALTDQNGFFARTKEEVLETFSRHLPVLGKPRSSPVFLQL